VSADFQRYLLDDNLDVISVEISGIQPSDLTPNPRLDITLTLFVGGPPVPDSSNTVESVHRLKQEIDRLTEQQSQALQRAIYTGMTPDEAKEYDGRRKKITQLLNQLSNMEKAL